MTPFQRFVLLRQRMNTLLEGLIELDDADVSDAEFVGRLATRFRKEWSAKQPLIDPSE